MMGKFHPLKPKRVETVGELIEVVAYLEGLVNLLNNSRPVHENEKQCDHDGRMIVGKWAAVLVKSPGVADLADLQGTAANTADWLRQQRSAIVTKLGRSPSLINAMTVPEFAAAIIGSVAESNGKHKQSKSISPGDADAKILATLIKWHKYRTDGSCENLEPIGGNELARRAGVSKASVSNFWKNHFGAGDRKATIDDYKRVCQTDQIHFHLATMNGDLRPGELVRSLADDIRQRIENES